MFLRGSDRLNRTCVFLGISPKIGTSEIEMFRTLSSKKPCDYATMLVA